MKAHTPLNIKCNFIKNFTDSFRSRQLTGMLIGAIDAFLVLVFYFVCVFGTIRNYLWGYWSCPDFFLNVRWYMLRQLMMMCYPYFSPCAQFLFFKTVIFLLKMYKLFLMFSATYFFFLLPLVFLPYLLICIFFVHF